MDKDELWSRTLSSLLENVDESDPKTVFLQMVSPVGIFGDQFVLLAENAAVETWVRNNYLDEIKEIVFQISGMPLAIGLGSSSQQQTQAPAQPTTSSQIPSSIPAETIPSEEPDWLKYYKNPDFVPEQPVQRPIAAKPHPSSAYDASFNENEGAFHKCTFDNFVVGRSNEFARGAALAVAEQPGVAYNPLFIYGDSGLGKTHLLISIANYVRQNFPHMMVRYVRSATFLNDYVEATQKNQWSSFNSKYHQMDVLLIDDVQELVGKEETINQFFNIFNKMKDSNKQIVLSADRAPKDIDMDKRMTSRFVSGILADVKPPDYETRLAILKNVITRTNFYGNIPDEVIAYIAETAPPNIREMESSITHLVSNMNMMKKDTITVEETEELLKDFFTSKKDKKINIPLIQSEVEKFFDISHDDMISSNRTKNVKNPRHIAIYLSRYLTEESLESIGKKFGGRDHSTILHSVNKIEKEQKENRQLYDQLETLRKIIRERS